jgi:predicted nucleic acid-binding protein
MIAIDTNVLVYTVDANELVKQAKARALLDQLTRSPTPTVLLWQVVAEFVACMRRWQPQRGMSDAIVDANTQHILSVFPLVFPTRDVFAMASHLHAKFSLSHWDSMLLAACIVAGVDTLYSEDLTDGAMYDTVRVVNPFI